MAKRGLGSPNMDKAKARAIHQAGGRASHGGGRPSKDEDEE
jgi:general stress protein YciG